MSLTAADRVDRTAIPSLRWRWTVAIIAGELVGFLPPALTGAALATVEAPDLVLVIGLTAAGVLEGVALGVAQHSIIGSLWPDIERRHWVAATAAAAGLAWLVGMGGSTVASSDGVPTAVAIGLAVVVGPLALCSMGYLQWLVLRRVVTDCARWVPVTTAAWLVGVTIPVAALSLVPNRWPPTAHVGIAVVAAVAMGALVGIITGGMVESLADPDRPGRTTAAASRTSAALMAVRFGWTVLSCFVVESIVIGLAALPAVAFYQWHLNLSFQPYPFRIFLLAAALLPAYALFAVLLMGLSAEAARLLGWRPPQRAELVISELPIELRNWARYAIMSHMVHVAAGVVFRSTPVWIWYMRRNGAKIGRHVWVNSLQVGDDCLLDFGDEVVIGAGVHLSGHTVERGLLRLAPIKLGAGTTVGIGAHVNIGVTTGPDTQIGSMSVVPKHMTLHGHTTYAGIPVEVVTSSEPAPPADRR